MTVEYFYDSDYCFKQGDGRLTTKAVVDLLNSIAAKDAEIERLKANNSELNNDNIDLAKEIVRLRAAAVKPSKFYVEVDGEGWGVFLCDQEYPKGRVAWFIDKSEAEADRVRRQPTPVMRWVSRDQCREAILVWSIKPTANRGAYSGGHFSDFTDVEPQDIEIFGIPAVPAGECHCYSVLDGVWTRVEE